MILISEYGIKVTPNRGLSCEYSVGTIETTTIWRAGWEFSLEGVQIPRASHLENVHEVAALWMSGGGSISFPSHPCTSQVQLSPDTEGGLEKVRWWNVTCHWPRGGRRDEAATRCS